MNRRPPIYTLTDTLFPYRTLVRSGAWGRRSGGHDDLDAWVLESAVHPNAAWTLFARGERTQTNELSAAGGHHGPTYTVGKVSLGAIRDWPLTEHMSIGLRSEEHTSELQSLMRISYAVFCLKK